MAHEVGEETLNRISRMPGFNRWMFDVIEKHLGERVLEVGCGIGNLTRLVAPSRHVFVLDIKHEYVDRVLGYREEIGALSLGGAVGDICNPLSQEAVDFKPDTVVCLNVLEHVKDDLDALRNILEPLQPGGSLVLLVPAFQSLHGTLDEALSHYRRYSRREIVDLARQAGAEVEKMFYLNLFGIPGWWLNGKILKRKLLPRRMLDLYQFLVPIFRFIEKVTGPPVGLSLIAVIRKG